MGSDLKSLKDKIARAIRGSTQGLCVRAYVEGEIILDERVGQTYLFYDWASLTKIVFTVTSFMKLYQERQIHLHKNVQDYLPWVGKCNITLQQLLTHSAGLPAWCNLHSRLSLEADYDFKKIIFFHNLRKLLNPRSRSQIRPLYSDVGFWFLGAVLENVVGKPWLSQWHELRDALKLQSAHFNFMNKSVFKKSDYAPTERCLWRKRLLRGEVHDDNAWAMGGVAPHAGLFGSMDDLGQWILGLRRAYLGGDWIVNPQTVKKFSTPVRQAGDWSLGFMLPTPLKSSSGRYFSKNSLGHTGFTGPSIWFDPEKDLIVCILTHRVYPTRTNSSYLNLRPLLHDWIVESISEGAREMGGS